MKLLIHAGISRFFVLTVCFMSLILLGWGCPLLQAAERISLPRKTIGVLSDTQSHARNDLTKRFQKALKNLAEAELTLKFPKIPACCPQWTPRKARHAFEALLKDPKVDLVFVNGPLFGSKALQLARKHETPIVGVFTFDPDFILPEKQVNIPSLVLTMAPGQVDADLKAMAEMFKTQDLTILVDEALLQGVKRLDPRLIKAARAAGFNAQIKPMASTAEETLAGLSISPKQGDHSTGKVMYLTPGGQFSHGERKALIRNLNDQGAYVFSGLGTADIQNGALAAQRSLSHERMARHAALNAMRLISGTQMKTSVDSVAADQKLVINEDTAAAVGYQVSSEVAQEAREVEPVPERESVTAALPEVERLPFEHHLKKPGAPGLTLAQAVQRALENNARLSVKAAEVEEDRQDRDRVLTELFPQVKGQVEYRRVDENAAIRSFETLALERSTGGGPVETAYFQ